MKRFSGHPLFRALLAAAIALLAVDMFFVAGDMMQRFWRVRGWFPAFSNEGWRAGFDGSFAEIWGYAKAIAAGVLLVFLFTRWRRAGVLLATAVLFFTVAADDMLQIHETGGGMLARSLSLPDLFGLRGQDLGELMIWAALGLPLVFWIAWAWFRSDPLPRRIVRWLVPAFAALLLFAVGTDLFLILAVHWGWPERATYLVSLVEIFGEQVALSAVFLVVLGFTLQHRAGSGPGPDGGVARTGPDSSQAHP